MTTSTASATAPTTEPSPDRPGERGIRPSLVDETVRAVGGYYGRLGRIGLDLARIVLPIDELRDVAARLPLEVGPTFDRLRISPDGESVDRPISVGVPGPGTGTAATSPTLLVEADGDRPGFGVFLVENLTSDPVSAAIKVSTFVDDQGHEVRPRLMLRPSTLSLGPGEHAMVQLAAELDEALESGVRYRGEIAIPGLSDRRIPIVLRRRAPTDAKPAAAKRPATKPPTARQRTAKAAPAKASAGRPQARPRRRPPPSPDASR